MDRFMESWSVVGDTVSRIQAKLVEETQGQEEQ